MRSIGDRQLRVVITGASSGVGAALAREYAKRDARLALIARRRELVDSLASSLRGDHAAYAVDVRDAAGLRAVARDVVARWGGVDVVIGNAGISAGTLTERADDQPVFQEIMDINVVGLFNTFQAFLPSLLISGRGTLVGIASVAGFRGLPGSGAYSASKAAAIAYLESLRVELRNRGVRVLTISPGYIDTPMTRGNPYPMPFMLQAEDAACRIANAIASGAGHAVIPWQMALVAAVMRVLPRPLYDALFARAPRKPQRTR